MESDLNMLYLCVKWLHIISATVLFGTGIGTAFFMLMAHVNKDLRARVFATRTVVLADWLFTAPAIVIQPVTGLMLIHMGGFSMQEGWLMAATGLYVFAGLCWLPVVWMQIRMKRMAEQALATDGALSPEYQLFYFWWITLGSLAFPAVMAIFWLMVAKPA
ncbi:MAG: DUF2269 domain-containing protein [Asticcacaulis sp.]